MNREEYNKRFKEYKEIQAPILKKYNGAKKKDVKKKLYSEIMKYEQLLWELELEWREK